MVAVVSVVVMVAGWVKAAVVYVATSLIVSLVVLAGLVLAIEAMRRTLGLDFMVGCLSACITRAAKIIKLRMRDPFVLAREESLETLATNKTHYFWNWWNDEQCDGVTVYEIILARAVAQGGPHARDIYDNILVAACNNGVMECARRFLDPENPHLHDSWRPLADDTQVVYRHLKTGVNINVDRDNVLIGNDPAMYPLTILCHAIHMSDIDDARSEALCVEFIRMANDVLSPAVMWARCERRGAITGDFSSFADVLGRHIPLLHELRARAAFAPHAQEEGEDITPDDREQLIRDREELFHDSCFTGSWDAARDILSRADPAYLTLRNHIGMTPRDNAIAGIYKRHSRIPTTEEMDTINSLFDKPVKSAVW